jgi:two-component system response regulator PilR (NtrC family)
VDVRLIAATNKNIKEEVSSGSFREDLFYRLNVVPITIPPLRERTEDVPLLVENFLGKFSQNSKRVSPDAMHLLMNYPWRGNVRELENIIERLVLLCDKDVIMPGDLPEEISQSAVSLKCLPDIDEGVFDLEAFLGNLEKDYLLKALERSHGVKTEAAKLLSLSFRSFRHRLYKHGIK